jgi:RNA polymerase sigma factor (sigma-70 family)
MSRTDRSHPARRPGFVAALLVGTALSALGPASPSEAAVGNLSRYCTACWRNARIQPDAWSDCTQEVLTRFLERVGAGGLDRALAHESVERQEFLRAIDAVKKRSQRARRYQPLEDTPAAQADGAADDSARREAVLDATHKHLSPRQARIIARSLDGWSVADIARELRLPAARVSDEKYKAIRRLRAELVPEPA